MVDRPPYTTDLFLCSCEERANEAEELRLQLQSQMSGLKKAEEACLLNEEDEQQLKEETKDLQRKLDEEKRRSASCDLQVRLSGLLIERAAPSIFQSCYKCRFPQVNLIQRFLLDYHHADQKKIEDLERQVWPQGLTAQSHSISLFSQY